MTIVAWPEKPSSGQLYRAGYQRKRYEAAMSRLRVAVAMLEKCYGAFAFYQEQLPKPFAEAHDKVFETLESIGELPVE